jgi:hypothetical protein
MGTAGTSSKRSAVPEATGGDIASFPGFVSGLRFRKGHAGRLLAACGPRAGWTYHFLMEIDGGAPYPYIRVDPNSRVFSAL